MKYLFNATSSKSGINLLILPLDTESNYLSSVDFVVAVYLVKFMEIGQHLSVFLAPY